MITTIEWLDTDIDLPAVPFNHKGVSVLGCWYCRCSDPFCNSEPYIATVIFMRNGCAWLANMDDPPQYWAYLPVAPQNED